MVMDISADKVITAMNSEDGMFQIQAKDVIVLQWDAENVPGRLKYSGIPSGRHFIAGTAQRLVNIEGYLPGREVVILDQVILV